MYFSRDSGWNLEWSKEYFRKCGKNADGGLAMKKNYLETIMIWTTAGVTTGYYLTQNLNWGANLRCKNLILAYFFAILGVGIIFLSSKI